MKLTKIKEMKEEINRDDLIHKIGIKKKNNKYNFQKNKTIRFFGREVYSSIIKLNDAL